MDQNGRDRRIDATRQTTNDLLVTNLRTNAFNRFGAEVSHGPVIGTATNVMNKVRQELATIRCMHDLRVEHHAIMLFLFIGIGCVWCIFRHTDDFKARRQLDHTVTMAHPNFVTGADFIPNTLEQRALADHFNISATKLAMVRALSLATGLHTKRHLTIADTKNWDARIKDRLRCAWRSDISGRRRTTRENDPLGAHIVKCLFGILKRHDLGIDARLTHTPSNQLRDL